MTQPGREGLPDRVQSDQLRQSAFAPVRPILTRRPGASMAVAAVLGLREMLPACKDVEKQLK